MNRPDRVGYEDLKVAVSHTEMTETEGVLLAALLSTLGATQELALVAHILTVRADLSTSDRKAIDDALISYDKERAEVLDRLKRLVGLPREASDGS